mgnify:CR=1 FL=1
MYIGRVMEATEGAYMRSNYGDSWPACARLLLGRGLTENEATEFLLSKHMRWADDSQGRGAGRATNSTALARYLDDGRNLRGTLMDEVALLVVENPVLA